MRNGPIVPTPVERPRTYFEERDFQAGLYDNLTSEEAYPYESDESRLLREPWRNDKVKILVDEGLTRLYIAGGLGVTGIGLLIGAMHVISAAPVIAGVGVAVGVTYLVGKFGPSLGKSSRTIPNVNGGAYRPGNLRPKGRETTQVHVLLEEGQPPLVISEAGANALMKVTETDLVGADGEPDFEKLKAVLEKIMNPDFSTIISTTGGRRRRTLRRKSNRS